MRLRTAKDRLKIEHSIIDGLRPVLEELLAANPEIRSVIPGVIRQVRDAKGKVKVRVTVPTQNGWKAIALSAGARQELFVSTEWSTKRYHLCSASPQLTPALRGSGVLTVSTVSKLDDPDSASDDGLTALSRTMLARILGRGGATGCRRLIRWPFRFGRPRVYNRKLAKEQECPSYQGARVWLTPLLPR